MAKVIVERPRRGRAYAKILDKAKRSRANQNLKSLSELDFNEDVYIKKDGKRKRSDYKELNENLSPLFRYLRSKVGKNWNKIYSEICENINPSSTVQQHILDHIKHYVYTEGLHREFYAFYVDDYGCLRENKRRRLTNAERRKRRENFLKKHLNKEERVIIDSTHFYEKINGIWYYIETEIVETETVDAYGMVHYGIKKLKNKIKKQLSTEELAAMGLRNEAEAQAIAG